MNHAALLQMLMPAVHAAGEALLRLQRTGVEVRPKPDGSPVTDADRQSERILLEALRRATPDIPVVSEESPTEQWTDPGRTVFWLVDPLDGTREYVEGTDEYTINLGLIENGRPTLGIVHAPALKRTYCAAGRDDAFTMDGSSRRDIHVRQRPAHGATVLRSRSHGDADAIAAFLAGERVVEQRAIGSSLKFCLVAEGAADLYPRLGTTMEWDTAAGDAILRAAGGSVVDLDGVELRYGKPDFRNPSFVARGR